MGCIARVNQNHQTPRKSQVRNYKRDLTLAFVQCNVIQPLGCKVVDIKLSLYLTIYLSIYPSDLRKNSKTIGRSYGQEMTHC